ncbi:MAG: cytochrome C oxidase Cbb3 [Gammaproteobacteria bacterium]|nr:MAG: cytochrome C oxidase Cbb3 [Gammaproteobacteria bacterium]
MLKKSAILFCLLLINISHAQPKKSPLYQKHCAVCHGIDRTGISAPALLSQNLKRVKKNQAKNIIKNGLPATQMLGFNKVLNDQQIDKIIDYIYSPAPEIIWQKKQILSSYIKHNPQLVDNKKFAKPIFKSDPLNLFVVVESGDHHISIVDGDNFKVLYRFVTRFALHGGPKFSPDGRFVYITARDGWISMFDLYNLKMVAEIRVGINSRNAAVSSDGKYLAVANYLPRTLVILDAKNLNLLKIIPVKFMGKSSRVSAVYDATPRGSFVLALKDIEQIWEINYQNPPPAGFGQWTHDYNKIQGDAQIKMFPIRKIDSKIKFDDFFFDQNYVQVIGASRDGKSAVIDLDIGKQIATPKLAGMPHLSSGITWNYKNTVVLATPNLKQKSISIIDTTTWKTIKEIKTEGIGFFMRSHKNSLYAWADVFFGPDKDKMMIIDKKKLEIIKTIMPIKNKTSAHIEFDRYGKNAWLSIWEKDGFVIIYDAKTLKEIKRLKMSKPVGKYNVYNKITKEEGTSH